MCAPPGFDSVTGWTAYRDLSKPNRAHRGLLHGQEFVVYKPGQVYPAYVVNFKSDPSSCKSPPFPLSLDSILGNYRLPVKLRDIFHHFVSLARTVSSDQMEYLILVRILAVLENKLNSRILVEDVIYFGNDLRCNIDHHLVATLLKQVTVIDFEQVADSSWTSISSNSTDTTLLDQSAQLENDSFQVPTMNQQFANDEATFESLNFLELEANQPVMNRDESFRVPMIHTTFNEIPDVNLSEAPVCEDERLRPEFNRNENFLVPPRQYGAFQAQSFAFRQNETLQVPVAFSPRYHDHCDQTASFHNQIRQSQAMNVVVLDAAIVQSLQLQPNRSLSNPAQQQWNVPSFTFRFSAPVLTIPIQFFPDYFEVDMDPEGDKGPAKKEARLR